MWLLADVNVPDELIKAAEEDKLVLFVGAGVSCGSPSNLPSYRALAEKLAEEQGVLPPTDTEQLDRFISKLPNRENAHVRTMKITCADGIVCNDTHKAIMRLASSMHTPRIVTTNYDSLLEQAAERENIALERIFSAPALPLGDSFDGLVHLHGGGPQGRPNEIVLDDKDFGSAYLTGEWATRFLVPLFDTYSVVFVGYSLSDTIMQYLLGGLKSFAQPQFAFVAGDDSAESSANNYSVWEERGIIPIKFPLRKDIGDPYSLLPQTLTALSDYLLDDYESRKSKVSQIVRNQDPPTNPVDIDYLTAALRTEDGAICFTQLISIRDAGKMNKWGQWILTQETLSQIFAKDVLELPAEQVTGKWLLSALTLKENFSLLEMFLQAHRAHIGSWFFSESCDYAIHMVRQEPEAARMITLLYCYRHSSATQPPFVDYLDLKSLARAHLPAPVLQWLIPPQTVTHNSGVVNRSIISLADRQEDTTLPPDSPYFNKEFVHFAENQLRDAHELDTQLQDDYYTIVERPAVEIHEQNNRFNPISSICVETLRDYAWHHPGHRDACIHQWWESQTPMLQRLALYTIAISEWSADKKLKWIMDHNLLESKDCHHEAFFVMAQSIDAATDRTRKKLLIAVQNLDATSDEQLRAQTQYNIINWLLDHMQDTNRWRAAVDWRAHLVEQYHFRPSAHPDFHIWRGEAEWIRGVMEQSQLAVLLRQDLTAFPPELLPSSASEGLPPELYFTIHQDLPQVIKTDPELGIRLWDLLTHDKVAKNKVPDCFNAILDGWLYNSSLSNKNKEDIIRLVCASPSAGNQDNAPINPLSVVCVIRHCISENNAAILSEDLVALCDNAVQSIWNAHYPTYANHHRDEHDDILSHAMNVWPGEVAQYWIDRIKIDFRQSDTILRNHLPDRYQNILTELVEADHDIAIPTRAVVLSQVQTLHDIDSSFTETLATKIMNGPNKSSREFIWGSLLPQIPLSARLLLKVFFDSFIEEIEHVDDLPEGYLPNFLGFVVYALSLAGMSQDQKDRVYRALTSPDARKYNAQFMKQTTMTFRRRTQDQRNRIWDEWLHDFVARRSQQEGGPWQNEEQLWYAAIIPLLGRNISQGMELLESSFPTFPNRGTYPDPQMLSDDASLQDMSKKDIEILVSFYREFILQLEPARYNLNLGDIMDAISSHLSDEQLAGLKQLIQDRDIQTKFPDAKDMSLSDTNKKYQVSDQKVSDTHTTPEKGAKATRVHQRKLITEQLAREGYITTRQVGQLLGVKQRRARTIINEMIQDNLLQRVGKARATRYCVAQNKESMTDE